MGPDGRIGNDVLIVEDDGLIRRTLARILRDEGYTVSSAANGQEAIDQLRSASPPRLILLDLMMPVMNAWQFRAEQAQDPNLAPTPVVIISSIEDVQQQAASLGVSEYLKKPVQSDVLLSTIRNYCPGPPNSGRPRVGR